MILEDKKISPSLLTFVVTDWGGPWGGSGGSEQEVSLYRCCVKHSVGSHHTLSHPLSSWNTISVAKIIS